MIKLHNMYKKKKNQQEPIQALDENILNKDSLNFRWNQCYTVDNFVWLYEISFPYCTLIKMSRMMQRYHSAGLISNNKKNRQATESTKTNWVHLVHWIL